MVSTQIELTEEQVKALEALAQKRRLSLGDLIRESIDSLLQAEPRLYTEEQKRRALAAVGRYKSGLGDLSRRHDDYLTEPLAS